MFFFILFWKFKFETRGINIEYAQNKSSLIKYSLPTVVICCFVIWEHFMHIDCLYAFFTYPSNLLDFSHNCSLL